MVVLPPYGWAPCAMPWRPWATDESTSTEASRSTATTTSAVSALRQFESLTNAKQGKTALITAILESNHADVSGCIITVKRIPKLGRDMRSGGFNSTLSFMRTWAITKYELTWDLRKKRTPVVVGLILLAAFYFAYLVPIVFGKSITEERTLLGISFGSGLWWVNTVFDVFNLFATGLFPLLIGGFIAADSLATEFDENTIVPLLSQPVRRSEVYFGKFFAKFLILLAVAVLFTLVTVGLSQASLGGQENLGMIPLVVFAEFGAFLEFAAIGFFLGSIARSGMMVLGLLIGLFFGVIWTVLLLGFQYGIQEPMFLLPVANAGFLLQVVPYYVFQPWGVMVLQGVALGDYTQQTTVMVISAMDYVLAGLVVNIIAFLVAGYYFFRRAEVKG